LSLTELLTLDQAAARLQVSRRTLSRLMASGQVRVVRFTQRSVRIKSTELEAFVAACERRSRAA
jgi:excisionase family DNA binding protein